MFPNETLQILLLLVSLTFPLHTIPTAVAPVNSFESVLLRGLFPLVFEGGLPLCYLEFSTRWRVPLRLRTAIVLAVLLPLVLFLQILMLVLMFF